jgi:hypothetical protein
VTVDAAFLEPPDYAEAVTAWRVWRIVLRGDGYRLASVVHSTVWPTDDALEAVCARQTLLPRFLRRTRRPHQVPDAGCECGIYGTDLERLGPYVVEEPFGGSSGRAVGRVSLWGTVVECERGFRASRAFPQHLYVPVDGSSRSVEVRRLLGDLRAYGVPVEVLAARCADAPALLGDTRAWLGSGRLD